MPRLSTLFMLCCIVLMSLNAAPGVNAQTTGVQAQIAFVSERDGNQEIYLMSADGTNAVNLTNNPANDWHPAWSPDGSRIAYTSNRDGNEEIYVMNADGTGVTNLTNAPGPDNAPTWSPDGTRIAWMAERDGRDIWIMNADGTNPARVTGDGRVKADPAWSPDGTRIAYWQMVGEQSDIFVIDVATGAVQQLTNNPANDGWPRWYTDNRLLFDTQRDGNWEVYSMNADSSQQTNLTRNIATDVRPNWSLWEGRIAFTSERDGNAEVYTMLPDGSGLLRLTNNPAPDHSPAWRPNPALAAETMTDFLQFTYTPDRMVLANPSPDRWMLLSDIVLIGSTGSAARLDDRVAAGGAAIIRLEPGTCVFWRADTASTTPTEDCGVVSSVTVIASDNFWSQGFQIVNPANGSIYACPAATPDQRTRCIVPR